MVTVRHGSGLVADTVVWEILPQQVAEEWLGGRVCDRDRQFVERELEAIVHLRGLVREGEPPPTSAASPHSTSGTRVAGHLRGPPRAPDPQWAAVSLTARIATTSTPIATSCAGFVCAPSTTTETTNAPTAPMPTHTA